MLRLVNDETRIVYKASLLDGNAYCLQVMRRPDEMPTNGMRVRLMPADSNVRTLE